MDPPRFSTRDGSGRCATRGQANPGLERRYDPTLRAYVKDHGLPDYLYVASRYMMQLVYVDKDRVVLFERPTMSSRSQATETEPIPDALALFLTDQERSRLMEIRSSTHHAPGTGP